MLKQTRPCVPVVGMKYGKLTIIREINRTVSTPRRVVCRCDCGNASEYFLGNLRSGSTQSCGCYRSQQTSRSAKLRLSGKKFNRLKVIKEHGKNKRGNILWLCKCDCGKTVVLKGSSVKLGHTKSCGCLLREITKLRSTKHGLTIGNKITPEYTAWTRIKQSCKNPRSHTYGRYGGRGIKVCAGTENINIFLKMTGNRPSKKHSIGRIENNLHYSCGQCNECKRNNWKLNYRWELPLQQSNNKSNNVKLTYKKKTMTLAQWSRSSQAVKLHLTYNVILGRRRRDWTDIRILTTPNLHPRFR